jgi:hypothetical protein
MGIGSSDILAGRPVICCNHVAAVVKHSTLTGGTVVVWNWKIGNQVAMIVSSHVLLACVISNPILSDQYLRVSESTSFSSTRRTY